MDSINVQAVEFYPEDNAKENYTDEYDLVHNLETPTPILRRGQTFFLGIRFDRLFDEEQDVVRVHLSIGPNASINKGTKAILPVSVHQRDIPNANRWNLAFIRNDGDTIIIQAYIPATAQVGIWKCSVQTNVYGQQDNSHIYQCPEDIYILFNAWCQDDLVYMENEEERKEYILNENGKIWMGTYREPRGKRWVFGQFDDVVLPAAVFLLEKSGLPHYDRGSPILISRVISAMVNFNDDNGVIEGRWDGDYSDGTSPFAWTGSAAILDEYLRKGGQPVKYGQCWVFSAVAVTICRALGLPCRSVTNYVSAHDTNRSLTVDKFFDIFGNIIEKGPQGDCNDSCWNFHVWNDVWMRRPDLPPEYSGWQVIDSTPQELSGNIYCCGPAPVEAVKRGEVGFLYDTPFVFSEVNADICHFQEDQESDWGFSRLSINRYHVGRKILTKRQDINDDDSDLDMWDITHLYKSPEGSEEERRAVFNAIKGIPLAQQHYDVPPRDAEDVTFDLVDIDSVLYGQDFDVVVNIVNNSEEMRNITASLSASSIYYTGVLAHHLQGAQGSFSVKGGDTEVLRIHVPYSEYLDKLVDHNLIKIYAIAHVKETKQSWCEEDDFTLMKPELRIEVQDARVGEECTIRFSIQNPLSIPLTDCTYRIEGHGLIRPKSYAFREVQPNETVAFEENVVPRLPGRRVVVATFNSNEIRGIGGSATVNVD